MRVEVRKSIRSESRRKKIHQSESKSKKIHQSKSRSKKIHQNRSRSKKKRKPNIYNNLPKYYNNNNNIITRLILGFTSFAAEEYSPEQLSIKILIKIL